MALIVMKKGKFLNIITFKIRFIFIIPKVRFEPNSEQQNEGNPYLKV